MTRPQFLFQTCQQSGARYATGGSATLGALFVTRAVASRRVGSDVLRRTALWTDDYTDLFGVLLPFDVRFEPGG